MQRIYLLAHQIFFHQLTLPPTANQWSCARRPTVCWIQTHYARADHYTVYVTNRPRYKVIWRRKHRVRLTLWQRLMFSRHDKDVIALKLLYSSLIWAITRVIDRSRLTCHAQFVFYGLTFLAFPFLSKVPKQYLYMFQVCLKQVENEYCHTGWKQLTLLKSQ